MRVVKFHALHSPREYRPEAANDKKRGKRPEKPRQRLKSAERVPFHTRADFLRRFERKVLYKRVSHVKPKVAFSGALIS